MANTYMFTGFPGFLASQLLKEVFFEGYPVDKIYLIYLKSMTGQADLLMKSLVQERYIDTNKIELLEGDITATNLGMDPETSEKLSHEVTHFFHLAALYDLAIPLPDAWRVNVQGTRQVNRWLKECPNLKKYIYFSTAYVSGKREGRILETELIHNDGFKNHYEYTKYEAEKLVDENKDKLPITIIRPGIVVGHSTTGETVKFDGPYFILNMLDRFRKLPMIPYFGKGNAKVNLVPQDYVLKATIYLAHHKETGKTYHLTDPSPYTAREIYQKFSDLLLQKKPKIALPLMVANQALQIRSFRGWIGMQQEALEYFTCECEYDTTEAQKDLEDAGITCPDLTSYIQALIDYYKQHKNDERKHVSIIQ